MRKLALCLLALAAIGAAQDALKRNETVARELAPGAPQRYEIRLNDADYAAGSIEQHGPADIAIFLPDGRLLRRFPGGENNGKRPFAFIAEGAGAYRMEVSTPAKEPVRYELRLEEVVSVDERIRPKPREEKFTSAKIATLRKQVDAGSSNTDVFWKAVAEQGTPLVEGMEDPKYQLATFLWRGNATTQNVLVFGSYSTGNGAWQDKLMHHLAATDVWYLRVNLPAGARFAYQLSPNDPLIFEGPTPSERIATLQADPLNPHRWACPEGASKFACQSMAELRALFPNRGR